MVTYGEDKLKIYKTPIESNKPVKFEEMKVIPTIFAFDTSSKELRVWDMDKLKKYLSIKFFHSSFTVNKER